LSLEKPGGRRVGEILGAEDSRGAVGRGFWAAR
jgi:hypothetical protein